MHGALVTALAKFSVAEFRRWVAVLCVTVFVFSIVTHTAHDNNTPFNVSPSHVANVLDGHTPDVPAGDINADATHCHGCISAHLPIGFEVSRIAALVAKRVAFATHPLFANSARPDFPPPKA